jgi:hypothetical protein
MVMTNRLIARWKELVLSELVLVNVQKGSVSEK